MTGQAIANELRERILSGELAPGSHVPSARQIMRKYSVAIATATKALGILRQEGLVDAVPGRGTIVAHRLSKPRIVEAALAIADTEGIAAVSMRRIAHKLGVATMSLYHHVPSKDALLLLLADAVFTEEKLPTRAPEGWRKRLEVTARLQWKAYRKHRWLAGVLSMSRPQLIPSGMEHTEWVLAALDSFGLSREKLLVAGITVMSYVRGAATNLETEAQAEQETGLSNDAYMEAQISELKDLLKSGAFPTLARVSAPPKIELGLDRLFEFGLARLLDGMEAYLTSQ